MGGQLMRLQIDAGVEYYKSLLEADGIQTQIMC